MDPVVAAWYAGVWSPEEAEAFADESRRRWCDDGCGQRDVTVGLLVLNSMAASEGEIAATNANVPR